MGRLRIAVLGSTGMVGSMVLRYLKANPAFEVWGTHRGAVLGDHELYFDAQRFLADAAPFRELREVDYLINCIGVLKPYCADSDPVGTQRAIEVNALFPHRLAEFVAPNNRRIIHIATDGVFSGRSGGYTEESVHDASDVYGRTKSLGESQRPNVLNIRCSVIGPELTKHTSLLDWFLAQPAGSEISGFAHHLWNGVTSLQFAQLCEAIVREDAFASLRSLSPLHHFTPNEQVSKYDLLTTFAEVFRHPVRIKRVADRGEPVDRTLVSSFKALEQFVRSGTVGEAVAGLRGYLGENWRLAA